MITADRIAGPLAPERLTAAAGSPLYERKLHSAQHLVDALRALPRPRVFTNGVFDLLHRGHVTYLAQARALGASLIVALNDDASVRRLGKGADRPINPLADRLAVISALESVDLVTWFEGDTPIELIRAIGPDILAKGGDWSVDAIVGAPEVLATGGAVVSIPFCHDRSTTALLGRVRAQVLG